MFKSNALDKVQNGERTGSDKTLPIIWALEKNEDVDLKDIMSKESFEITEPLVAAINKSEKSLREKFITCYFDFFVLNNLTSIKEEQIKLLLTVDCDFELSKEIPGRKLDGTYLSQILRRSKNANDEYHRIIEMIVCDKKFVWTEDTGLLIVWALDLSRIELASKILDRKPRGIRLDSWLLTNLPGYHYAMKIKAYDFILQMMSHGMDVMKKLGTDKNLLEMAIDLYPENDLLIKIMKHENFRFNDATEAVINAKAPGAIKSLYSEYKPDEVRNELITLLDSTSFMTIDLLALLSAPQLTLNTIFGMRPDGKSVISVALSRKHMGAITHILSSQIQKVRRNPMIGIELMGKLHTYGMYGEIKCVLDALGKESERFESIIEAMEPLIKKSYREKKRERLNEKMTVEELSVENSAIDAAIKNCKHELLSELLEAKKDSAWPPELYRGSYYLWIWSKPSIVTTMMDHGFDVTRVTPDLQLCFLDEVIRDPEFALFTAILKHPNFRFTNESDKLVAYIKDPMDRMLVEYNRIKRDKMRTVTPFASLMINCMKIRKIVTSNPFQITPREDKQIEMVDLSNKMKSGPQ